MAYPFGGHPTHFRFIEFAQQNGCSAEESVRTSNSGRVDRVLRINSSTDQWIIIVDPDYSERLSPSIVAQYQRRLGLKIPYSESLKPS